MVVELVGYHSRLLEGRHISSFVCQIQAWLGIFEDVGIPLDKPNNDCKIFLMERCHLHHLCIMDVSGILQHSVANHMHVYPRYIEDDSNESCKVTVRKFVVSKLKKSYNKRQGSFI